MKLSKVLLGSAVAVALVVGFAGCKPPVGNDLFSYTDATYESAAGTATIDYDNTEGDSIKRGIKFLATKRTGVVAIITMENQTTSSLDGMLGIAFAAEETSTDVWDFAVTGTQNLNGKGNAYISCFHNIAEDNFDASNFGAWNSDTNKAITEKAYNENTTTSYEIEVAAYSKDTAQYVNSVAIDSTAGTYTIAVKIEPTGTDASHKKGAGGYKVSYYKASDIASDGTISTNATAVYTKEVTSSQTGHTDTSEWKLGFYGNVYAGKTLKGSIKLLDVYGNPIPIEWDETTEASPLFK